MLQHGQLQTFPQQMENGEEGHHIFFPTDRPSTYTSSGLPTAGSFWLDDHQLLHSNLSALASPSLPTSEILTAQNVYSHNPISDCEPSHYSRLALPVMTCPTDHIPCNVNSADNTAQTSSCLCMPQQSSGPTYLRDPSFRTNDSAITPPQYYTLPVQQLMESSMMRGHFSSREPFAGFSQVESRSPSINPTISNHSPLTPDLLDDYQLFQSSPTSQSNDGADGSVSSEPYAALIYRALKSAPEHKMVLREIYEWFEKHTDKAKDSGSRGWQNSIRHNLSMNGVGEYSEPIKNGKC